jgi:hypothetical protein
MKQRHLTMTRYFVSAVEAWTAPESGAFVIIGDSITDGRGKQSGYGKATGWLTCSSHAGSTTNANNR